MSQETGTKAGEARELAEKILASLAEAAVVGHVDVTWYGYVELGDVRRLAELVSETIAAAR